MTTPTATGIVRMAAFWAPDGRALADFYAAALGWAVTEEHKDEDGNCLATLISDGSTSGTTYVFYTARHFQAPDWPAGELPFHLDLAFDDVQAAEERLLELGATKPAHQPGAHWTVLLDPSGQPFCLSTTPPSA
ncbi:MULTISPECIES: VOC family protein [unclassified Streptomyces]|uniref:VOC family protein n=1 Tax=unclassified Streptomyces TaxID=2593676 RepID=UPI00039ACCA1|nr:MULTISPECIES: VOC family protein [unclassified Streptomyces]MYT32930.1 VOC family protein [Streptomyces sp. SID8354]